MTSVLVCGGRNYMDSRRVRAVLDAVRPSHLIEGGARGADRLAQHWAFTHDVPFSTFKANWTQYGRSAGPRRNQTMLAEGKPDLVIAFPGGAGTRNMVMLARAHGVEVRIIE